MKPHKTKTIVIDGEKVQVDAEIVPLVQLLNTVTGISTFTSCQGHFADDDDGYPWGYVMFVDCNERRVMQLLTGIFRQMNTLWRKWQAEHRRRYDAGTHEEMMPFEFMLYMGDGWQMKWGEGMYSLVFEATKIVTERMKTEKEQTAA